MPLHRVGPAATRFTAALLTLLMLCALTVTGRPAMADVRALNVQAPLEDISARVSSLPGGSVLRLPAGEYAALVLNDVRWTTPVTIQPLGGRVAFAEVRIKAVHNLRLIDVDVAGRYSAVRSSQLVLKGARLPSILLRDGVSDVTLEGNTVDGRLASPPAGRGVTIYSNVAAGEQRNHHIRIVNSDIGWHAEDNVFAGPVDDLVVHGNRIHDIPANSTHQDGIQLMDGRRLTITNNEFWGQDEALMLKAETSLRPTARVGPVLIRDNLFHDSRGAGIILAGTEDVEVLHNTAWNNVHADLHFHDEQNLRAHRNVFFKIWDAAPGGPRAVTADNCIRWFGSDQDIDADPRLVPGTPKLEPGTPCRDTAVVWGARAGEPPSAEAPGDSDLPVGVRLTPVRRAAAVRLSNVPSAAHAAG